MADVEIKGAAELQRLLGELPANIERNVLRGALRAGAKEIEREAKALTPVKSGALRASIRVSAGAKGGNVFAHIKAGGRGKGEAFYATMVEKGTKPHEERPRGAKSLFFAGLFSRLIEHPGAREKPFMAPAFANKSQAAVDRIAEYIRARLDKIAKARPGP